MTAQRLISVLGLAAAVGLLALLGWGMVRPDTGSASPGVNSQGVIARAQQRPAPELRLRLFDGKDTPWTLSEQRGKMVVINFWASWCNPCRTEAPVLAQAARDYKARNIILVGVNVWDDKTAAEAFLNEFGIAYPNGQDTGAAAVDYGVTGIPETFVVDAQGMITMHWIGPITRDQLDVLVAEPKATPTP
ncbi:MAG: TlpA family protein disulfide reductase [Chloroflexi bacterium]|nr:TlpA family protein disulfide reductase [Chloroflexota bacterium]